MLIRFLYAADFPFHFDFTICEIKKQSNIYPSDDQRIHKLKILLQVVMV